MSQLDTRVRELRASHLFHVVANIVEAVRDEERDQFENQPASEYNRGRVAALTDLMNRINPRG